MPTPASTAYVPPPAPDWARARPEDAGLDPRRLAEAVAFARGHESERWPRQMIGPDGEYPQSADFAEPPEWRRLIGPVRPHAGPNGVIVRHGRIVAEWGDPTRVDMTFSISKSYIALAAGLAVAQGLIRDVGDKVRDYGLDDGFEAPQNRDITWEHLLHQTSEWEGELWGKPDLADRGRVIGGESKAGTPRALQPPGTHWEYNDVRVNRLALSLTLLFRRAIPGVLSQHVMQPIGTTNRWEWPTYEGATVEIDGKPVPSVPGGAHWGGGLWISSLDHARVGLLVLRGGRWGERQVLPGEWIDALRRPAPGNPNYGYLWWLNTDRALLPAAGADAMLGRGAGTHLLWLEPAADLVVVSRWVDAPHWDTLSRLILDSVR